MTDFNVHFDPPSRDNVLYSLENTTNGEAATFYIASNFYSVSDMLQNTTRTGNGGSVVHLLTGDSITFDNLPKPRLARIARSVAGYFGFNGS